MSLTLLAETLHNTYRAGV